MLPHRLLTPRRLLPLVAGLFLAAPLSSQAVTVDEPECLAVAENAVIRSTIDTLPVGGSVRLYFRRLNPEGAFYWVEMLPDAADGAYWTVFPKPADTEQTQLTESWWQEIEDRDWMEGRDRDWLEDWLAEQENEASEYWVGVYDSQDEPVTISDTHLVPVFRNEEGDDEDEMCPITLTERQAGWAQNLTIGETAPPQYGDPVFHWLCDGIVTRIDWQGIYRADSICRRCIVAWFDRPQSLVPAAVLLGGGTTILEASPSRP